jgi:hypothetical protein
MDPMFASGMADLPWEILQRLRALRGTPFKTGDDFGRTEGEKGLGEACVSRYDG